MLLHGCTELADGVCEVGCERAVHVRFQGVEVDLNHLIEVRGGVGVFRIALEVLGDPIGHRGHFGATGAFQVSAHAIVVAESAGSAPISAPMLAMVPLPVQLRLSAPGPKYSTMAPVPPFTVRIPATFRITSLLAVQPFIFPVSFTPISLGNFNSQGSRHHVHGIRTTYPDGHHARVHPH